ncbi:peptidoglycan-binding protein [Nitratireductor basaltis]|uniref:Peptidoglycan-binding domain 1 protein n=1 Tax=Nitratireductor basaltis TaxID=472175 RepID=A0A084UE31_9HYPH|nr:peptidoglycan-binding protein [Nitratireductor basaltis]KFB11217.1 Peptidoglycan-binding domain 1 protein [Nitratireductor basaltis]
MNSKRSYLDNLNQGRTRRSGHSLDEINRTLDHLEDRLERALEPRERPRRAEEDIAERMRALSNEAAARFSDHAHHAPQRYHHEPMAPQRGWSAPEAAPRQRLERVAQDFSEARKQEQALTSISELARELQRLREDMGAMVNTGFNREFEGLRQEISRVTEALHHTPRDPRLHDELERISHTLEHLSSRSDDKSLKMLRLELEQVKGSIASLAREDSIRHLDQRWDAFEERMANGMREASDPALASLSHRVEEIAQAVSSLPHSMNLRSLEERVQTLATALEHFAGSQSQPDLYAMVEERLDEISRAISASVASTSTPGVDSRQLERIEARISSLAAQLDEVANDRPSEALAERLNALTQRIDTIATRIDVPEQAVERLSAHITQIAQRMDSMGSHGNADQLFQGLEERFAHLSDLIEKRQEDAIHQGFSLFQDLERRLLALDDKLNSQPKADDSAVMAAIDRRLAEFAERMEQRQAAGSDPQLVHSLEARLEDISSRLQQSAAVASHASFDQDVIRNLESQVALLSQQLSQPGHGATAETDDVAPRLESLERAISESRETLMEAARQAASQAVAALGSGNAQGDERLRDELQALEALTRKSDERNTKTFEAIHDTLLKIVNRLGSLEAGSVEAQAAALKMHVEDAPRLNPADGDDDYADFDEPQLPRTPAEAAAAAAEAALRDDRGEEAETKPNARSSMLGGLRALRQRKSRATQQSDEVRAEPDMLEIEPEGQAPEIEAEHLDMPLEPGSGTPDLNSIMRRVRDEKAAKETGSAAATATAGSDAAKADFIAAARRAAQAAAAEAEVSRKKTSADGSGEGGFSIGNIIGRRKKQLLLTLGAAAVIAGGAMTAQKFLQSDENQFMAQAVSGSADAESLAEAKPLPPEREAENVRVVEPEEEVQAASAMPAAEPAVADDSAGAQTVAAEAEIGDATDPEMEMAAADPEAAEAVAEEELLDAPVIDMSAIPAGIQPQALRVAASQGDAEAIYEIASRLAEGRGIAADLTEAAKWYEMAAEQGLAPAQYRLGNLYEKGTGVERDFEKAKTWYQLAAQQGNASAMHNLGVLFAMGADGAADNDSAARWFIEAADRGVTDSQFNLGVLYAKGVGVQRDLSEAYKWFDIASRAGDPDAASKRDEIAAAMAPADLAKAQGKAKLWQVREPDAEANIVDVRDEWRVGEDVDTTAGVDMKKAIQNIQAILNQVGFDAGAPDGIMGNKTRMALKAFQKANGLDATGEVNDQVVRALLQKHEALKQQ